jgi:hypothetical protein
MSAGPAALAIGDKMLIQRAPGGDDPKLYTPNNHFAQAFWNYKPGQRYPTPGFADNEQYAYYAALARNLVDKQDGTPPKPLAFRLIFDATTERLLFDRYYDDAPRPPGINRFDLYSLFVLDGKLEHYRSQKKGPSGKPVPLGSRMGPQNMIVCGWALQLLKKYPGIWNEGHSFEAQPLDEFNRRHISGVHIGREHGG